MKIFAFISLGHNSLETYRKLNKWPLKDLERLTRLLLINRHLEKDAHGPGTNDPTYTHLTVFIKARPTVEHFVRNTQEIAWHYSCQVTSCVFVGY